MLVRFLGLEDPLGEEGMAAHSGVLIGKSHEQRSLMGCSPWVHRRVRHDGSDLAHTGVTPADRSVHPYSSLCCVRICLCALACISSFNCRLNFASFLPGTCLALGSIVTIINLLLNFLHCKLH